MCSCTALNCCYYGNAYICAISNRAGPMSVVRTLTSPMVTANSLLLIKTIHDIRYQKLSTTESINI